MIRLPTFEASLVDVLGKLDKLVQQETVSDPGLGRVSGLISEASQQALQLHALRVFDEDKNMKLSDLRYEDPPDGDAYYKSIDFINRLHLRSIVLPPDSQMIVNMVYIDPSKPRDVIPIMAIMEKSHSGSEEATLIEFKAGNLIHMRIPHQPINDIDLDHSPPEDTVSGSWSGFADRVGFTSPVDKEELSELVKDLLFTFAWTLGMVSPRIEKTPTRRRISEILDGLAAISRENKDPFLSALGGLISNLSHTARLGLARYKFDQAVFHTIRAFDLEVNDPISRFLRALELVDFVDLSDGSSIVELSYLNPMRDKIFIDAHLKPNPDKPEGVALVLDRLEASSHTYFPSADWNSATSISAIGNREWNQFVKLVAMDPANSRKLFEVLQRLVRDLFL